MCVFCVVTSEGYWELPLSPIVEQRSVCFLCSRIWGILGALVVADGDDDDDDDDVDDVDDDDDDVDDVDVDDLACPSIPSILEMRAAFSPIDLGDEINRRSRK